ncbi:MAG: hypothetical protein U9Q05_08185 [Thermodesulfobacteriota bacterium]|nr:hypothetical protein [Thermodesulfobacteriota bacterium]
MKYTGWPIGRFFKQWLSRGSFYRQRVIIGSMAIFLSIAVAPAGFAGNTVKLRAVKPAPMPPGAGQPKAPQATHPHPVIPEPGGSSARRVDGLGKIDGMVKGGFVISDMTLKISPSAKYPDGQSGIGTGAWVAFSVNKKGEIIEIWPADKPERKPPRKK